MGPFQGLALTMAVIWLGLRIVDKLDKIATLLVTLIEEMRAK